MWVIVLAVDSINFQLDSQFLQHYDEDDEDPRSYYLLRRAAPPAKPKCRVGVLLKCAALKLLHGDFHPDLV